MILSVSAVGRGPLSYKWKKDGKDISYPECIGNNTDTLTIHSFTHKYEGLYKCTVTDSQKSIESEPANLTLGLYKCCLVHCVFILVLYYKIE